MKTDTKKQYDIALGRRIRAARKAAKISPELIAKELGVTRQSYNNKERGKNPVTVYELTVISGLIGKRVDVLANISVRPTAIESLASIPIAERVAMY